MRDAAGNRAWQAAVVLAHDLVSMLAVEVAAGSPPACSGPRSSNGPTTG